LVTTELAKELTDHVIVTEVEILVADFNSFSFSFAHL
jgi:hypothetical protein